MKAQFRELGELAEFINGVAFKPDDWSEKGPKIIRIQNLTDGSKQYNRTTRSVDKKYLVLKGDLLVSWSATLDVFEWNDSEPGLLNQHIFRVIPRNEVVDKRFLRHALVGALADMAKHLHGATMQHVNRGEFLSTEVFLPPLEEQRRIAAILDKADALRQTRSRALQKLDSLTQSIFLDMFGDLTTNLKGWTVLSLGEIVDEFRYGTSNMSADTGRPALRIPNVIGGTLDLSELKTVPVDGGEFHRLKLVDGDLLFVRTNGNQDNVGRCAVFDRKLVEMTGYDPDEFIFASYLIRARVTASKWSPIFLREFLLGRDGRMQLKRLCKTSAGQFNINTESLCAVRVIQPPLKLQNEFSRQINKLNALRKNYDGGLVAANLLFDGLQHSAFRGEL